MKKRNLSWALTFFITCLLSLLSGCALLTVGPKLTSTTERLKELPTQDLPLSKPVKVRLNAHQVAHIEAQTDEDLAFSVGLLHAHHRLGQIELFRYISQGRISELAGPLTVDLDKTLRILSLGRAADEIERAWPESTRSWAESYLAGLNHYILNLKTMPMEFRLLGIDPKPWTMKELITFWRLASAEINWFIWISFLSLKDEPSFAKIWQDFIELGSESMVSFEASTSALGSILNHANKFGSNSVAISKAKSRTGGAMIVNDPHLGVALPNFWYLMGWKSPSFESVGMSIPGIPIMGLGRNKNLAWGGTNMWGLSSYLFELTEAELKAAEVSTQKIKVKGWFDSEVKIRWTAKGPVISDAPFIKSKMPVALYWLGHSASDEITAFLKANRSQTVEEFRKSFATYAVSAQNMLAADTNGEIAHVLAYAQPILKNPDTFILTQDRDNSVVKIKSPLELPMKKNPLNGFLVSSNNKPAMTKPEIGWFFQSSDRQERLTSLLAQQDQWSLEDAMNLQQDQASPTAQKIQRHLSHLLGQSFSDLKIWREFCQWDGLYRADSSGAAAFEILMSLLAPPLFESYYQTEKIADRALRGGAWKQLTLKILQSTTAEDLTTMIKALMSEADRAFKRTPTWGLKARLRASHALGMAPYIGSRFRFNDYPANGGPDTVNKASIKLSTSKEFVNYGTNSRHISDLSDVDQNYFVLFGGQDGWMKTEHTLDQIDLFLKGKYIQMPLSSEKISEQTVHLFTLMPASPPN